MPETERIRFGIFDFDPATRELRREGTPVRLQPQPAQVLALLLENAGEIVTREALRQAVWGAETFVDFDRGLNFCIAQIRSALADSAESPRFVKTLPKRGYQFIAPVTPTAIIQPIEPPARATPKYRFSPTHMAIAALGLVVVAVILWSLLRTSSLPSPIRVAVARFDNQTDNAQLDNFVDGLTDAVVAELTTAAAGRYAVIGNAAILRQPRGKRDLIAIGSALHARYVILGQVQRAPSGVHVLAHLIRLPEQTHLLVTRIDAAMTDPQLTQSDLASRIATAFSPRLTSQKTLRGSSSNIPSNTKEATYFLTHSSRLLTRISLAENSP